MKLKIAFLNVSLIFSSSSYALSTDLWLGGDSSSRIMSLNGEAVATMFGSNGNPHIAFNTNLERCKGKEAGHVISNKMPISISYTKTVMDVSEHKLVNFRVSCMGAGYGNGSQAFYLIETDNGRSFVNDVFITSTFVAFGSSVFTTHNFVNEFTRLLNDVAL